MPWAMVIPNFDPLVINDREVPVRKACGLRYPNHSKGCPNYGTRESCPPKAPMLYKVLDPAEPIYAAWNVFDLGAHARRMKAKHPGWSWRQLVNCRHWQQGARKLMMIEVRKCLSTHKELRPPKIVACPEACGVNVTATMAVIDEVLEWPPKTKTYQVTLVGVGITPERAKMNATQEMLEGMQ